MTAFAVQKAVYQKLSAALTPLSCPVFDHAPADQPMPFAVIGRHSIDPDDGFSDLYTVNTIVISIFSGSNQGSTGGLRGKSQALALVTAAKAALHHAKLSLDVGRAVLARIERSDVDHDSDGVTIVASMILRVDTEG